MNNGIQKWAVVAYVTLCIYFLAQPSPGKLNARAESLDKALSGQNAAVLSPALADALDTPVTVVDQFLTSTNARPSGLVFKALLRKANSQSSEDPSSLAVLKSGLTSDEAIAYFDAVEAKVVHNLSHANAANVHAGANSGPQSGSPGMTVLGSHRD